MVNGRLDLVKLRTLVDLERLGTMAAVGQASGYATSAVSQQIAALERQLGTVLVEADGRRVRLTPAARRLVERGRRILEEVEAAERDLSDDREPHGLVRVAGNTSQLRRRLVPGLRELRERYPRLELELREAEPDEIDELLDADRIDVGFAYDYSLVPRIWRHDATPVTSSPMVLAVPPGSPVPERIRNVADLAALRGLDWIGNSRDLGDDELAERICALGGWVPRTTHRADGFELVIDLVLAGEGVCVLPTESREMARIRAVPIDLVDVARRGWAVVRAGRADLPAVDAVVRFVRETEPLDPSELGLSRDA